MNLKLICMGKRNILVVDDSPVMRRMIIKTIRLCQFDLGEIFEAGNGVEALQEIEKNAMDLLFLDINMPEMDGIELLTRIRKMDKYNTVPIFIISTESNQNRIDYIKSQNADFLHKPFTPEDLRRKISQLETN